VKSVPDVSHTVTRNRGSTRTCDQAAESAQGARAVAAATREPWLVDAANHTFLQAMYTSSIRATLLSLIGVAFVLRCFRSDR
jgi:hypothetical protein